MIGEALWPVKRDELNSGLLSANILHSSDDSAFSFTKTIQTSSTEIMKSNPI